jgi:methylphosphotriester-DNA--protein-cysteine methyltransferase
MPLPENLPTNPDDLEELYENLIAEGNLTKAEMQRLLMARLHARGLDPEKLTTQQVADLISESMERIMRSLQRALKTAPEDFAQSDLKEILEQAEKLNEEIQESLSEAGLESNNPPTLDITRPPEA